ncbi:MAG TPA: hypothetical protein VMF29_04395 [Candidatus Edwardsbacteria bacterium]|nr:hypothetical protein [Candidatus Edwardsbacteria bacterium]
MLRWLVFILLIATGSCLLFQGCSKQTPTEAPASTTVITGSGTMSVNLSSGPRDDYTFSSAGRNYGKISLATYDGTSATLEAQGIQAGSGTTAPESGYGSSASCTAQSLGQGFFIKADTAPHYGRIVITSYTVNGKAQTITVGFDWVVQTTAGDRNLQ